ncbi:MAG: hypothetical protein GEU98_12845 [Pseudonocardiaceae bacterium]|nr:hypothetical protein [Pseudonocardiaceae bacterium]
MKNRGNGSGGPEDVDAAFAEIIAGLESEGVGRDFAKEDDVDVHGGEEGTTATATSEPERGWRTGEVDWDPTWRTLDNLDDEDDHYHPPEPPPLPKPRRGTVVVLLFIAVGVLLLTVPGLIGLSSAVATPIALLAITCGFGFFVLSKRHGPPPGADSDGAQL